MMTSNPRRWEKILCSRAMGVMDSIRPTSSRPGSMSGMQLVLLAAGIPLEAIAILLIIERPLDTFRTAVNVEGDLIAALVIDKWQRRPASVPDMVGEGG